MIGEDISRFLLRNPIKKILSQGKCVHEISFMINTFFSREGFQIQENKYSELEVHSCFSRILILSLYSNLNEIWEDEGKMLYKS